MGVGCSGVIRLNRVVEEKYEREISYFFPHARRGLLITTTVVTSATEVENSCEGIGTGRCKNLFFFFSFYQIFERATTTP